MKMATGFVFILLLSAPIAGLAQTAIEPVTLDGANLPESKVTKAGRYIDSAEAYRLWQSDEERVKIIDVRTTAEYAFVGHPTMAANIPLLFTTRQWHAPTGSYAMQRNERFVAQVEQIAAKDDVVLVLCRSGQRSAPATDLLNAAGYESVYSVVDGFEGDKLKNPASIFDGQRKVNGWRNAGLPWTYRLDPALVYQGEDQE